MKQNKQNHNQTQNLLLIPLILKKYQKNKQQLPYFYNKINYK